MFESDHFLGIHACQLIVGRGEQILGLIWTRALFRLWDAAHHVLQLFKGFKPLRSFVTPSPET